MRLFTLTAENYKNLEAVELKLDGEGVIVTGANGAGKSNVLSAISTLFLGKKAMPARPIKDGADKAQIVGETEPGDKVGNSIERGDKVDNSRNTHIG